MIRRLTHSASAVQSHQIVAPASPSRRACLGTVAGVLLAIPIASAAGREGKLRRIGFLSPEAPDTSAELERIWGPLRALGWIDGRSLQIERRYASGEMDLLPRLATDLVRLNVEIIVTNGTSATLAAKNATVRIPIVMMGVGDPLAAGLVSNLARPGGNVTGSSNLSRELDIKGLHLFHELLPQVIRVGCLTNPSNPYMRSARKEYEEAIRSLGLQPVFIEVNAINEVEGSIAQTVRQGAQAVIVPADSLFQASEVEIPMMQAALRYALPALVPNIEMLKAGGLMSYVISAAELYRRLAYFIDQILGGARPPDLPVQQPTQFELGINLKTAKTLGIAVPRSFLLRADQVIQAGTQ